MEPIYKKKFFKAKWNLSALLFLLLATPPELSAQCTNSSAYMTVAAPTTTTPLTISSCTYQSEYNTITGVAASTTYSSSNSAGGCITVHQGTPGGPVIAYGASPLSWTSTVAGTYYIHYTVSCNPCVTTTGCTTTTITCTSCGGGGGGNPCTSITNIAACGSSVTANLSGTGAGWNISACGFSTTGDEQIYSFTPTTTGTYSLNVTNNTGGYIDYFWVNSTSGCSATAPWNCIDDIFSAGTYGAMSWTAGQTYYILLDPEGSGSYTATFSVSCLSASSNPCSSITNIAACGTSVTATMSGTGAPWNVAACGFSTPGDEVIYSFTPTTTGTYSLNVTGVTNGYIDAFWVNSTSGCSATAPWSCIQDIFSVGTYGNMSWTAGQTYYILLDPENSLGSSMTFSINCAVAGGGPCGSPTNIIGCGASYSANLSGTGAWLSNPCGFTTSGVEALYTYTATTTGNHAINITSITGGFIDFAFKPVSAGCSSTGWTCIDDVFTTGTSPSFFMTAGVQYYILLDPEPTTATSVTFNLNCPGNVVTASDCNSAVNICDNANFQIDPNGYGAVMEIPPLGTVGNPDNSNPGGSTNWGCLRSATPELNSTWMIVNIASGGNLEFSFGAGGTQAGFYDWIMYPYDPATTCSAIPTGNYAPVRCNWNGSSTGGTGCASAGNIPAGGSATNYEPPLPVNTGDQYIICFSNYSSAVSSVPLDFFGTAVVSCVALPSELLNFDGHLMENEVHLKWSTITEINTSHFIVEYSVNGIDFEPIGTVTANGNSNQLIDYGFVHREPVDGTNYYRLQSVDYNNEKSASRIVTVKYSSGFEIVQVYPNPTDDNFNLTINSFDELEIEIEITDIAGKRVYFRKADLSVGNNSITVPANELADGLYNLKVINPSNNKTLVQKIIKQR